MNRFIIRFPLLFTLLLMLPFLGLLLALVYLSILDVPGAMLLLALSFLFVTRVTRTVPARILRGATYKLNNLCDPDGFLADVTLLRAGTRADTHSRFVLDMNYAVGLDAAGHSEDAYTILRAWQSRVEEMHPTDRVSYTINTAIVCLHTDRAEDARRMLASVRSLLQGQHPLTAGSYEEMLRSAEDAWCIYFGDTAGLRDTMAMRVARCRENPAMRRVLVVNCMLLGRLYEKCGMPREALGMYRYVAENGNGLGVVQDARSRAERLADGETAN